MAISNAFFNNIIEMSEEEFHEWKKTEQPSDSLVEVVLIRREKDKDKKSI